MAFPDLPRRVPLPANGRCASTATPEKAVTQNSDTPTDFDKATYQSAKPLIDAALKSFQDAGHTPEHLFNCLSDHLGVHLKAYGIRFIKDLAQMCILVRVLTAFNQAGR